MNLPLVKNLGTMRHYSSILKTLVRNETPSHSISVVCMILTCALLTMLPEGSIALLLILVELSL